MDMPCYVEFCAQTATVTLRHAKHRTIVAMFKLEASAVGTWERLDPASGDADNYWIAVKPADSTVFNDGLFRRDKRLVVRSIDFTLEGR